jgi:hypothetical protein
MADQLRTLIAHFRIGASDNVIAFRRAAVETLAPPDGLEPATLKLDYPPRES